jgi:hypothetical protein
MGWRAWLPLLEATVRCMGAGRTWYSRRFEDRILLVRAANEDSARAKAERQVEPDNTEYLNLDGERVQWLYRQIIDVHELRSPRIEDGTEFYSPSWPESSPRPRGPPSPLRSSTTCVLTPM